MSTRPSQGRLELAIRHGLVFTGVRLHDGAIGVLVGHAKRALTEIDGDDLDRLASAAFESDQRGGHHKGGPWTWHMIGEDGQESYRQLVRAVLDELGALAS